MREVIKMGILVCDINLFSIEQPVYVVEEDGQMALAFQARMSDLGSAIVDYCQNSDKNIDLIRILDKAGYANNVIIPDINHYAFHNYADFNVKIEVESK